MDTTNTRSVAAGWTIFFWIAAAYNIVIGGSGFFRPENGPMELVVSLLVLCFGIVYALVARDPLRFAPMLWAGVVGKVGVVAILGPEVMAGAMPDGMGIVLTGDALFALGFLLFLLRHRSG